MKNLLVVIVLAGSISALAPFHAHAQPSSGGPSPGGAPTSTPIDGGAVLLLAGGVGYALKKLRGRPRRVRKE